MKCQEGEEAVASLCDPPGILAAFGQQVSVTEREICFFE